MATALVERESTQIQNLYEHRKHPERKKIVLYEPDFDTYRYKWLYELRLSNLQFYEQKKQVFDQVTAVNLQTTIGERLNAGLNQRRDEIQDGSIRDTYTNEPLVDILERGRKYRAENGSSPSDQLREKAEVIGFLETQKILCDESARVGTMMLSISPPGGPGSIYKHNFYDIFTVKQDKQGKKYIDARRYSSALDYEEYVFKVLQVKPDYFYDSNVPKDLTYDGYFLSHPIKIDPHASKYKNPDDIHADFHKAHEYVSKEEYAEIIKICTPFILHYVRTVCDNPYDIESRNISYNAILNKADQVFGQLRSRQETSDIPYVRNTVYSSISPEREIDILGRQPVRQVAGGCGPSSGFSKSNATNNSISSNPFSVSEFGLDQEWFICPKCNYKADGPVGNKCPGCGVTKEDYVEQSGELVCD